MRKMKSPPINEDVYNYILDHYVPENELLSELLRETESLNIPLIQISPEQGKFLFMICKMIRAKNALEIGTLTGYSGIHIASGLSHDGKLITVEKIKAHGDIATKYFKKSALSDKAEVVISPALDYMKKLTSERKSFDFIFIDADKATYPDYFCEALKLSHSGSVIAFDNMLKDGRVILDAGDDADLKAVQMTNRIISENNDVDSLLIPVGDGITICVVK